MKTLGPRRDTHGAPDTPEPVYRLDIMTQDDVPEVSRVERRCFANPWPASAYRRELQNPEQNYYVVVRETPGSSPDVDLEADDSQHPKFDRERAPIYAVPRRALLPISLGRRQDSNGVT